MKLLLIFSFFFLIVFDNNALSNTKKNSFLNLSCENLENEDCISRALAVSACSWVYEMNYGRSPSSAFKISYGILQEIVKGKNLNINDIFDKNGKIKIKIEKETKQRINFCKKETKLVIANLIKNRNGEIKLTKEKIENLADEFPKYFLSLFKKESTFEFGKK